MIWPSCTWALPTCTRAWLRSQHEQAPTRLDAVAEPEHIIIQREGPLVHHCCLLCLCPEDGERGAVVTEVALISRVPSCRPVPAVVRPGRAKRRLDTLVGFPAGDTVCSTGHAGAFVQAMMHVAIDITNGGCFEHQWEKIITYSLKRRSPVDCSAAAGAWGAAASSCRHACRRAWSCGRRCPCCAACHSCAGRLHTGEQQQGRFHQVGERGSG
jgi:hypothetical protein